MSLKFLGAVTQNWKLLPSHRISKKMTKSWSCNMFDLFAIIQTKELQSLPTLFQLSLWKSKSKLKSEIPHSTLDIRYSISFPIPFSPLLFPAVDSGKCISYNSGIKCIALNSNVIMNKTVILLLLCV